MDEQISIITLIAIIVAVVAIFKLRSVLGRRTDDDDTRIDQRYRERKQAEEMAQGQDNVVTLPNVHRSEVGHEAEPGISREESEERIRSFVGDKPDLAKSLIEILGKDEAFDPEQFVGGARHAYELIVTAFAEGNRSELRKLLHPDVYASFEQAITQREQRGELIDQSFVGIEKADVMDAELSKGFAQITMRFVSQLISATRDRDGGVISGDSQRIKEVTDIWTFSRDVSTHSALRNPNWQLVATQHPQ